MELNSSFIIAALIVGVLFPAYALIFGGKTRKLLLENPSKKILVYKQTAIQLIILTVVVLLPLFSEEIYLGIIGLGFVFDPLWVIALFAVSLIGFWILKSAKLSEETLQKLVNKNADVQFILPTKKDEYQHMVFVSFVAGICEEIIYRGFLFWFLSNYMPVFPALLCANIPFALAHLTSTGIKNTIGAFVLAMIFSGAYLLTKSLWLPIVLHILVDIYAAVFAYRSAKILPAEA